MARTKTDSLKPVIASKDGFSVQVDRTLEHWLSFLAKKNLETEEEYKKYYDGLIKTRDKVLKMIDDGGYNKTFMTKDGCANIVFCPFSPKELKETLESLESVNRQLVELGVLESRETLKDREQRRNEEATANQHLHIHANETGKAVDLLKALRETKQTDWQKDLND